MKYAWFLLAVIASGCGCGNNNNNGGYIPQQQQMYADENQAYGAYNNCMQMGNPTMCGQRTGVIIHQDNSGNRFFEHLGAYYLIDSMINGRRYSYFGGSGYYPMLGSTYPSTSVINNTYVRNYRNLPPRNVEMQRRDRDYGDYYRRRSVDSNTSTRKKHRTRTGKNDAPKVGGGNYGSRPPSSSRRKK